MATGAQTWSTAAASNNSADSNVNWAEGMAPSAVNDSARAEMASMAMWIKDNSGTLATSGTTLAYTVATKQIEGALTDGYTVAVKFHATNDTGATLSVDGLAGKPMQLVAGTNLSGGEFLAGTVQRFRYDSGSTAWLAHGSNVIGAAAVNTANIANSAITYAKIQNESAGTILGNGTGGSAAPQELVLGTGLSFSSGNISAPAFPPSAAFKNLAIKVATTTTVAGSADFATLTTSGSTSFVTVPLTGTINFASTGVVNGIDSGTLANTTIYAIYGICQTATSTGGGWLASTSFTTPLMPAGYNYKARLGAVATTTTTSVAALYGTWQLGRELQFIGGLAGTTTFPLLAQGSAGTYDNTNPTWATVSTTKFMPSTASKVNLTAVTNYSGNTTVNLSVAPSTYYGGKNTATLTPAFFDNNSATVGGAFNITMLLESQAVRWTSGGAGGAIWLVGWEDNI